MASRLSKFCLLMLITATAAFCQTTMGAITGLVSDATGAVIGGAAVSARNIDTGVVSNTVSSSTGNYVILSLQVGSYEVTSTVTGFKSWKRGPVALNSGDNARIDISI